jgi:tetratricopeptide (TPR) repeat protein
LLRFGVIYPAPFVCWLSAEIRSPVQLEKIWIPLSLWVVALLAAGKGPLRTIQVVAFLLAAVLWLLNTGRPLSDAVFSFSLLALFALTPVYRGFNPTTLREFTAVIGVLVILSLSLHFPWVQNRSLSTIGNYLCVLLPFSFARRDRKAGWLMVLLPALALVLTRDLNALLVGGGCAAVFYLSAVRKLFWKTHLPGFVILVVLQPFGMTLLAAWQSLPGFVTGRALILDVVQKELLPENWLTGVGYGGFPKVYNLAQARYLEKLDLLHQPFQQHYLMPDNTFWAFNEYVQFAVENGVPCTLLLVGFLYYLLKKAASAVRKDETLLKPYLALAAALGLSFFDNALHVYLIYSILFPSLFLLLREAGESRWRITPLPALLAIGACLLWGTFAHMRWVVADQTEQPALRIQRFRTAQAGLPQNGAFLYQYGVLLAQNGRNAEAREVLGKAKDLLPCTDVYLALGELYRERDWKQSEHYYRTAALMVPKYLFPKYQLFELYRAADRPADALIWADFIGRIPLKTWTNEGYIMKQEALKYSDEARKKPGLHH